MIRIYVERKHKIMNKYLTYFNKTILSENSTQYVLRIFSVIIWASLIGKDTYWFRLFGKGLLFGLKANRSFSLRNGNKKYLNLGKWDIEYLP